MTAADTAQVPGAAYADESAAIRAAAEDIGTYLALWSMRKTGEADAASRAAGRYRRVRRNWTLHAAELEHLEQDRPARTAGWSASRLIGVGRGQAPAVGVVALPSEFGADVPLQGVDHHGRQRLPLPLGNVADPAPQFVRHADMADGSLAGPGSGHALTSFPCTRKSCHIRLESVYTETLWFLCTQKRAAPVMAHRNGPRTVTYLRGNQP